MPAKLMLVYRKPYSAASAATTFNSWLSSQPTRDVVVNRPIGTLSATSILSKRYNTLSSNEASVVTCQIEDEVFSSATVMVTASTIDGIETLQLYSREISKHMLKTNTATSSSFFAFKWVIPFVPKTHSLVSPDTLNPLLAYLSLPQVTFGPKSRGTSYVLATGDRNDSLNVATSKEGKDKVSSPSKVYNSLVSENPMASYLPRNDEDRYKLSLTEGSSRERHDNTNTQSLYNEPPKSSPQQNEAR
ncbi:hypothetical protein Fmac_025679 [Flemingia macrophylla]|uniref:WPP domain-containing protein n=1 Tax=Flemingia macrophylla TaxID=520843 RepID=A0ABD1LSW4_9FABA